MIGSSRAACLVLVGLTLLPWLPEAGLASQVEEEAEAAAVTALSSGSCGQDKICHRLEVTCGGLEARGAEVIEYEVSSSEGAGSGGIGSRGTVVVATGVYGNQPYDRYPERQTTLKALREAGFEVFALRWSDGKLGWGSTAKGAGYEAPMCGYSAVVRWLLAQRADTPEVLCAQGNSGAALQIAYGLAVYGLGDVLDLTVLTGGPPLVEIDDFCFRPTRQKKAQLWRANGRRITDYLMGWEGDGDHCKNASGNDDQRTALQTTGLLPATLTGQTDRRRLLHYPTTDLVFVLSEGDKSRRQARLFHDVVTSKKAWHELPGRVHGVDREAPSAATVRELLISGCEAVADALDPASSAQGTSTGR